VLELLLEVLLGLLLAAVDLVLFLPELLIQPLAGVTGFGALPSLMLLDSMVRNGSSRSEIY
jgi:hypothetical protein